MIGSADAAEYIKTFDDPAMRASLEAQLDQTRANDKKAFQAQTEQQAVQVEQDFGALQQEVKTGYAGIPSIENAYKKGMLGDGVGAAKRRTQLLAAEATYQERHGAQQNLMSRVEQGLPVDAKDPKARRAVDDAVSAVDPNTGQPPTSEVMQDRAFNFAKSANVVAPLMQSQMRVGIASNDPQQLLWAAQSYRRLTREAPTADTGLDQRQQAVAEFASTLNEYGTPPAEIVRRVAMAAQKTDEERLRLKDQFDQQFNVPGAATSALNDQLKDAALHRSLMHPLTSSVDVTPEMTQEFRYLARENYARLGEDDPKYALGAAANMVISRYQPTTINGDATFLPFAAKWNQNEDANKKDLETTAKGGTFYQAAVNPTAQGDVHLAPVKIDDPKLITIRPIAAGFDPFKQYPENVRNGTIESQGNVWQILYDGIPLQHQDGLPVVWQPIEQTDAKLTDLTDQYNTQLSPAEEKKYQEWLKTRPEKQRNTYDYDLRGAFKADAQPSARGHLTDTYKKPNHPTFSTDSKYSGSGGNVGGQWKDLGHGNWSFTPSATNLKMHTKEQLQEYMKRNDPKVSLSFAR
jgi:hypothetical protein